MRKKFSSLKRHQAHPTDGKGNKPAALAEHNCTRPFPYNGTFVRELFQIARSIPTHFPKVKENGDEFKVFWFTRFSRHTCRAAPCSKKRGCWRGRCAAPPAPSSVRATRKRVASRKQRIYSGLRARMKALTNFPSMPARSSAGSAAIAALAPLSATSCSE